MQLDAVDDTHRTEAGHECRAPIPDRFFDEEDEGGEPGERDQQQMFEFLHRRAERILSGDSNKALIELRPQFPLRPL